MFTGLTGAIGTVRFRGNRGGAGALLAAPVKPLSEPVIGESIAVNGVCLTLERVETAGELVFHTLAETLKRSNLGGLPDGAKVNLERALRLGDRLGGHLVTGHIDAVAAVLEVRAVRGGDRELRVAIPAGLEPYFVGKGSVAIDGVSLTIVALAADSFTVHLIPATMAATNLNERRPGDKINLETDLIGKYVHRQLALGHGGGKPPVSMEVLAQAGW